MKEHGVGGQEKYVLVLALVLLLCYWASLFNLSWSQYLDLENKELNKVLYKVPPSSRILVVYLGLSFT